MSYKRQGNFVFAARRGGANVVRHPEVASRAVAASKAA
jgi:hypothetical protein